MLKYTAMVKLKPAVWPSFNTKRKVFKGEISLGDACGEKCLCCKRMALISFCYILIYKCNNRRSEKVNVIQNVVSTHAVFWAPLMLWSRMLFYKKVFFRFYMIHAVVALISWVAPFFFQLLCRKSQTVHLPEAQQHCQVLCLIGSLNDCPVIAVFLLFFYLLRWVFGFRVTLFNWITHNVKYACFSSLW